MATLQGNQPTATNRTMNKYVLYTAIFLGGVILANRVKALPVVGPMIPQV